MVAFYDIIRRMGIERPNTEQRLSPDIAELELRYLRHLFHHRIRRRPFWPPLRDCCRMRKDDRDND